MLAFDLEKNTIDYSDFTVSHYRELLRLAYCNWPIVTYENIPWESRFLLWRHDCDYSLNRAKILGQIESEEGVHATYFVNPRCEFYNLLERSQIDILHELQNMGHQIGLHFDGMFHASQNESELVNQLQMEANILEAALGFRPKSFSFHNPSAFHLSCEEDSYAGMLNCYSKRFKKRVAYTSDSNGYWRYRRLHDVLLNAKSQRLQILTHPGWWQDEPMTSRQRVFRAVYGRADATIRFFDKAIETGDRENPSGPRKELAYLRSINHPDYKLLDQLFHRQEYVLLILALWRLHGMQVIKLCQAQLHKQWGVPMHEVNKFIEDPSHSINVGQLFSHVFGISLYEIANIDQAQYNKWLSLRDELICGRAAMPKHRLEEGCIFLCGIITSVATWGNTQSISCDGINAPANLTLGGDLNNCLDEIEDEVPSSSKIQWEQLKIQLKR